MEDVNISKEEAITNQAFYNVQLIRNLPNILRSNNTKISKNRKLLSNIDTSFTSYVEDENNSLELNTTSSSNDLDSEANYNKTLSPKLHHQRKQVHNPLDIQYDISDCNNNKNKNLPQTVNQLNTLLVSQSHEKNILKKLKCKKKQKKRLRDKKLKKTAARKSGSSTQISYEKPDVSTIIPDINMKSTILVQNANNFLENDILIQPVYDPNFLTINVNDLNNIATNPIEPSNTFCCNNEVYNVKKCDVNLNDVISCKQTELNTTQYESIQRDPTNYGLPITENNLQQKPIDRYIGSNVFEPKMYSCSCANCMSHDKDMVFYEDPVSTFTNNEDMETGLYTCDLYTNIYDFYMDYFHIFGDTLIDFEETDLYYEQFGDNNITKENTSCNNTELVKSNVNVSSVDQNKSQNLQSYIDEIPDICVESYPTKLPTYLNGTEEMKNVRVFNETDVSNYLNLENFSMKEGKIISQDETLLQNAVPTNIFDSECLYQTPKNDKDLCVIQCSQCGKLFNKKPQLWKHFTRCNFYKENFQCHICNKNYRHKSSLAQHLRIVHEVSHNGSGTHHEKFYTCNKCPKSYVRFRSFQRHMLLHHD
ncbi:uncharacterized protein LOC105193256 isoform X4 [Solenopsis invicta]|nr:uncharacterized protein LOC105193256 isoform X4 [Solenopsis invicta]